MWGGGLGKVMKEALRETWLCRTGRRKDEALEAGASLNRYKGQIRKG